MKLHRHILVSLVVVALAVPAFASHSWGGYHWARTSNPFTVKIYDNLDPIWEPYLSQAVSDWNSSNVFDFSVVWQSPLTSQRKCGSAAGVIEICNESYGQNGWLGIAGISISGTHITKGYTKLNDTYYAMAQYNTPAWRRMVTCQEIAHDIGLAHQDENFNNANLGSCMDYTNDPDGGAGGASSNDPSNISPNSHDFQMISSIYNHNDSTTTIAAMPLLDTMVSAMSRPQTLVEMVNDVEDNFGTPVRFDKQGRPITYVRPISITSQGEMEMEITDIFWVPDLPGHSDDAPGRGGHDGDHD